MNEPSTVVDDLQRCAAEDSQLARWDAEDCRALEHRLAEALDDAHRSYLTKRLEKLRRQACAGQARSARMYAQARLILEIGL